MRLNLVVGALALADCVPGPPQAAEQPGPAFDPIVFFEGNSLGRGTVGGLFKGERRIRVGSVGRRGTDETLIVEQRIAMKERRRPRGFGASGGQRPASTGAA